MTGLGHDDMAAALLGYFSTEPFMLKNMLTRLGGYLYNISHARDENLWGKQLVLVACDGGLVRCVHRQV